jgi:hypothetical protein
VKVSSADQLDQTVPQMLLIRRALGMPAHSGRARPVKAADGVNELMWRGT